MIVINVKMWKRGRIIFKGQFLIIVTGIFRDIA